METRTLAPLGGTTATRRAGIGAALVIRTLRVAEGRLRAPFAETGAYSIIYGERISPQSA